MSIENEKRVQKFVLYFLTVAVAVNGFFLKRLVESIDDNQRSIERNEIKTGAIEAKVEQMQKVQERMIDFFVRDYNKRNSEEAEKK